MQNTLCMRKNGVPNFPDPTPTPRASSATCSRIRIAPGSGVDPGSPHFPRAQQACGKLIGGPFGQKLAGASASGKASG